MGAECRVPSFAVPQPIELLEEATEGRRRDGRETAEGNAERSEETEKRVALGPPTCGLCPQVRPNGRQFRSTRARDGCFGIGARATASAPLARTGG